MKRNKSKIAFVVVVIAIVIQLTGCNQAERVTANLTKEADNFNIIRRVTVINNMTDTVLLQLEGKISIQGGYERGELEILIENIDGTFSKEFVGLNSMTTYTVEQIGGITTSKYQYKLNFNPSMILPFEITTIE